MNPPRQADYEHALATTAHRPYALAAGRWRLRQRWNEVLFMHWPIAIDAMAPLLPAGLEVDAFDGFAWAGVVPFWMDDVQARVAGGLSIAVPTTRTFSELNLRTYVRSRRTGQAGVFFFSLDCSSWLAVLGARTLFHLPYFPAAIVRRGGPEGTDYRSRRLLTTRPARFEASYHSLGQAGPRCLGPACAEPSRPGTLEHFLTERYCLFTRSAGRLLVGEIHHLPWPLEPAEAEIRVNEIPATHGIVLPDRPPVLHFARELYVSLWGLRPEA